MRLLKSLPTYLDEKPFSLNGFCDFIKENIALLITTIVTILFVYGIRLANFTWGLDTELYITNQRYLNWMGIGRFGLVALQKLWTIFLPGKEVFNPWLMVFAASLFLLFGVLLWCYIIDIFAAGKVKKALYIPFSILFVSHQVWVEQFYYSCQTAECLFIIILAPLAVYFFYKGLLQIDKKSIIAAILLTVFCISVYQGVVMLIFGGIFALFLFFKENTDLKAGEYRQLCLSLLILMVISVLGYFLLNKIVQLVFQSAGSDYLHNMLGNEKHSISYCLLRLGLYCYQLVFAHIPFIAAIIEPYMAKATPAGWYAVEMIRGQSLMSNFMLAPAVIVFLVLVFKNKKRSFFYVAAAISLLLCVFAMPIAGGGIVPLRSQYIIPFASAFVFLYSIALFKNRKCYLVALAIFALCGGKQGFVAAELNYSDVVRFDQDIRLSAAIAAKISETGATADTPVFLYGTYQHKFTKDYPKGEVVGYSPFEWAFNKHILDTTERGVSFMNSQGHKLVAVTNRDKDLIKKARQAAEGMPDFPQQGSVQNLGGVIVVRLSETSYKNKKFLF